MSRVPLVYKNYVDRAVYYRYFPFYITQLNIIHKARNGPLTNGHTKIAQISMPVLTNKNIKDLTIITPSSVYLEPRCFLVI